MPINDNKTSKSINSKSSTQNLPKSSRSNINSQNSYSKPVSTNRGTNFNSSINKNMNNKSALNSTKLAGSSTQSKSSTPTSHGSNYNNLNYGNYSNQNKTSEFSTKSTNSKPANNKNKNGQNSFILFFKNFFKKFKSSKFRVGFVASILLIVTMFSVGSWLDTTVTLLALRNQFLMNEARQSYDVENYKTTTAVGYSGVITDLVDRNIPKKTQDEGLPTGYPKYGYTLKTVLGDANAPLRDALISEANSLASVDTANAGNPSKKGAYKWINSNGYLYNGTTSDPSPALMDGRRRKLYKHTASVGLYLGDVSDSEQGVVKQITMRPRGYNGYGVTGLYAPAGEVIKVTISESDMNATGGLTFHIGQALYNGQANNIWTEKNQMQRIPVLLNTLVLNKNTTFYDESTKTYTGYIGSFIGGPIYIRNTNATFTTTISGAVTYPHFILGYTTKGDFEQSLKSSVPYFDLEVWSYGVLHSGPRLYASSYSYDDLYKVAILWEKVSTVTTTGSSQGIVFLYDSFVAAGAAVAFPGRRSVNCPADWMRNALNYNGIVNSGSWGNFHEYHHNFQGFGVGNGGEVTNNAMTLVSYALFTKISANRSIGSYGAQGLGGWNSYTSATWALSEVLKMKTGGASNGNQGLTLYATLLHNFGPENFIQSKVKQQSRGYGQSYTGYLRAWQETTHNDMTYYFRNILSGTYNHPENGPTEFGITDDIVNSYKDTTLPLFVPVSCIYQTGRTYTYDNKKKDIKTMQPYVIPYGEEFTIDLRKYELGTGNIYNQGSIVLPNDFNFTVKSTPVAEYGQIVETETEGVYTYIPDPNHKESGEIRVTLELTKTSAFESDPNFGSRNIEDVELILEFEQSYEMNKSVLTRTTYTYDSGSAYTDAVTAFENNYAGYSSKEQVDNKNKIQNCNTDIWYTNQEGDNVPLNSVVELKGKIYADETAKYRISIRGRWNVALFVSFDEGKTYEKAAHFAQTANNYNFPTAEGTYADYELAAGTWVHFKAVMVTGQKGGTTSFLGVGWGKFVPEQGTINEDSGEVQDYAPEHVNVTYATAYRDTYQFSDNSFETDYMYKRNYSYTYGTSYNTNINYFPNIKIVDTTGFPSNYPGENLIDSDENNVCSSPTSMATKPWSFTIDLGKEITANRFVLSGFLYNGSSNKNQTPRSITLWVGKSLDYLEVITSFDDGAVSGTTLAFNFDVKEFRYYKLEVRKTAESSQNGYGYAAIRNINFSYSLTGKQLSPDLDDFTYSGSWRGKQTLSSFGHVYIGKNDSSISFNFTGSRLAILSSKAFTRDFVVFIDGIEMASSDIVQNNSDIVVSYLTKELENKEHTVKVVCRGESNIDSFVVF